MGKNDIRYSRKARLMKGKRKEGKEKRRRVKGRCEGEDKPKDNEETGSIMSGQEERRHY